MILNDVSSHMCASISKSLAGLIVIFMGQSFAKSNENHTLIFEALVVTYIMCYILVYTMMEPLQSSIRALYVCFIQNEEVLNQVFPLVYSRLNRVRNQSENFV
jgi:uncharacterized membrane protein